MSWGTTIGPISRTDYHEVIRAAELPEHQGPDSQERREQFAAAKNAAINVLSSEALRNTEQVRVSMSGHVGTNIGWDTSFIAVSVYTVSAPEEPLHAAEA